MPLRVHCPNGCLIHMSINRVGRIVRCPQCKAAIRIPEIPDNELASGKPVACQARIAKRRVDLENDSKTGKVESATTESGSALSANESTSSDQAEVDPATMKLAEVQAPSPDSVGEGGKQELKPRLPVPDLVKPAVKRRRPVASESNLLFDSEPLVRVHPVPEFENDSSRESTDQEIAAPIGSVEAKVVLKQQVVVDAERVDSGRKQETDPNTRSPDVEDSAPDHSDFENVQQEDPNSETDRPVSGAAATHDVIENSISTEPATDESAIAAVDDSTSNPSPAAEKAVPPQESAGQELSSRGFIEPELAEPEPERAGPEPILADLEPENPELDAAVPDVAEPEAAEPVAMEPETKVTEFREPGMGQPEKSSSSLVETFSKLDTDIGADIVGQKIDFLPRPETKTSFPGTISVIRLGEPAQPEIVAAEGRNWEERLDRANADRRVLARFFAICLCLVAVVNMVPALYHWYHWTQFTDSMALPRWIYIQVFVGVIHLVYAVFLFQINDWSAMRAVSVAMLVVAFVFGFISTGLLVGGGEGNLTGFLGIPYTLNRQACIWCVAMLCLATLMSYWGGKESTNWQRAEYLLKDILSKSAA